MRAIGEMWGEDLKIRDYVAGDAVALAALCRPSVREIGPRDYARRQVHAWAARAPTPEHIHECASDGRTTLVAVDDGDRPIGFIDLEDDGHIDFLYCAPEAAGRGAASALYDALEARARKRGVGRLYAEASEAARRAFAIGGVEIHNHAVEKALSHPGMV